MPISVNWGTKVVFIPKSYLTLVSGSIYELDLSQFQEDLNAIEESEDGMSFPDTHRHVPPPVLGGVTYPRILEIINNFLIEFEDGQYAVRLVGANSNIEDVTVVNQVSVRSSNSAGLITVNTAGTVAPTQQEIRDAMALATSQTVDYDSIDAQLAATLKLVWRLYQMRGLDPATPVEFNQSGEISFDDVQISSIDIPGGKRIQRS